MTGIAEAPVQTPPAVPRNGFWRSDASEPVRRNLGLVGVLLVLFLIGAISRPDIFLDLDRFAGNEVIVLRQGASIGVVEIEDSLVDAGAVMSAADTACYEASVRGAMRSEAIARTRCG